MFIPINWPTPKNVKSFVTTRIGGFSKGNYESFNLANHVGDDENSVTKNRELLKTTLHLSSEPIWLNQEHSNLVINANNPIRKADGCYTDQPNTTCVVLTADCLPILICNKDGTEIAAVHGGWRSLAANILKNAIHHFKSDPSNLLVFLGPAIGSNHFEVGEKVFKQFKSWVNAPFSGTLDIYKIARTQLNALGVYQVFGGDLCTYSDEARFYSYRRHHPCGRIASGIWSEK